MTLPTPSPLGLKRSFGYGDRLGLATPGHLAAHRKFALAPIFAQQSIREMSRTGRTPADVMRAAQTALAAARFSEPWGADADHLKTDDDVERTAAAGYCFFTIDPSEHVNNAADTLDETALRAEAARQLADGIFADRGWIDGYLKGTYEPVPGLALQFSEEILLRAAAKYARAIAHCERMAQTIQRACAGRAYEIEVSVDETDSPTSPEEHLFFGLELKRRGVEVVSLAPRFVGELEKGIDYRGDLTRFEDNLTVHAAIAAYCGPYKLSLHSGSDKFSIYPIIGRVCGERLHVKTAGTSYLEALRVVCRTDPELFEQIASFAAARFAEDRASYHISTTRQEVADLAGTRPEDFESVFLGARPGRQLLHVTFGSVLTQGQGPDGRPFKQSLQEALENHADLHSEFLDRHFSRHLELLDRG